MLAYSYDRIRAEMRPLIDEYLGNKVMAKNQISVQSIIKDLIPHNKLKRPWKEVFMDNMPYYYIYGLSKRNWCMIKTQELYKLERIVIKIIHRNIDIELVPLDALRQPKIFEELPIENYILYYCLLAFSGRWAWLMGEEKEIILQKVPGIEMIDWPELYKKYYIHFHSNWKKHLDI